MNGLWCFSILLLGFTASVAQVLLLRQLLGTFHGNELVLGVGLGLWMIGTASGSLAAAKGWFGRRGNLSLGAALVAASLGLPSAAAVGRMIGTLAGVARGEMAPLGTSLVAGLVLVLPLAGVLGALFALACQAGAGGNPHPTAIVGKVFVLEAVGATVGGLTATLIFIPLGNPLRVAMIVGAVCLGTGVALMGGKRLGVALAGCTLLVAVSRAPVSLEERLVAKSWPGYELLDVKESKYQSLVLVARAGQVSLFSDGAHVTSFPQYETPELMAHLPLLQHPTPSRVLLVGGGMTGILREILRHDDVEQVDYVELDPWVLRLMRGWMPPADAAALADARVTLRYLDGRRWVQRATPGSYDVVILSLPDPYTAQLNRFYTVEFVTDVARVLTREGVLAFRVSSAENYLTPLQVRYLGTLAHTLKQAFAEVRVTPGAEAVFLARLGRGRLVLDAHELLRRMEQKGLHAQYFSANWLPYQLTLDRLLTVSSLGEAATTINTDFRPICYFYDALIWSRQQGGLLPMVLEKMQNLRLLEVVLAMALPALVAAALAWRSPRRAAGYCLFTVGAAEITLLMVLMISYQAVSGFVYSRVSLFVALFMAGLAVGAVLGLRGIRVVSRRAASLRLLAAQAGVAVWCLLVAGVLVAVGRGPSSSGALILALSFPSGAAGGLLFPLASAVRSAAVPSAARLGASSYALDLAGSAVGTVAATAVVIPVLGLVPACLTSAALTGAGGFLLAASLVKRGR
jgi:spermidine synthase